MVNQSVQSLLADFIDADEHDLEQEFGTQSSPRLANPHREQKSLARFATQSRHSRRRNAKAIVPRGPRRRLRQPNGL